MKVLETLRNEFEEELAAKDARILQVSTYLTKGNVIFIIFPSLNVIFLKPFTFSFVLIISDTFPPCWQISC